MGLTVKDFPNSEKKGEITYRKGRIQYSPFIMLYLGSIGMDRVISESCLKGDNFTKEL